MIELCMLTFALLALPSLQCCGCWQYGLLPLSLQAWFQKQILPEYTCWVYTYIESELADLKWELFADVYVMLKNSVTRLCMFCPFVGCDINTVASDVSKLWKSAHVHMCVLLSVIAKWIVIIWSKYLSLNFFQNWEECMWNLCSAVWNIRPRCCEESRCLRVA